MRPLSFHSALVASVTMAPAWAQGTSVQSPGMPAQAYPPQGQAADSGQTTRFSSAFNPAFSFILDAAFDHTDRDGGDDGFDADLRVFELGANAWIDPKAWAYFIGAADEEELEIEEAAVHYVGLGGNHTLRAGRFLIDFGKQMQTHVHELRTLERPLVLRTYLGEEVKGDGLQWDSWTNVGESTLVRWSLGAFADLLPEPVEELDPATQAAAEVASPKDLQDFNFTARVTGLRDVGEHGMFQLGASARAIPSYELVYEPTGASKDDLSNVVYGLDATYSWVGDTGLERWTFGGEVLANTGDNGSDVSDPNGIPGDGDESIQVFDDTAVGCSLFGDYAWDRYHSAGLQFSADELPGGSDADELEVEAYFTKLLSEFHRLRFVAAQLDSDAEGDAWRVAVQYTATLGAHGHAINW